MAAKLMAQKLIFRNGELYIEFRKERQFSKSEIEGWHRRVQGKMEFKSFDGLKMTIRLKEHSGKALKKTLQSLVS